MKSQKVQESREPVKPQRFMVYYYPFAYTIFIQPYEEGCDGGEFRGLELASSSLAMAINAASRCKLQRSHTRMSVLELHGRLQGAQCYSYGSFEGWVWPCGCASISQLFGVLPVVEAAS